ncbi:hypothetical protein A2U01_0047457, partial [Trifolium medium]|nr:hypothetical protein [Trifolium medium]
MENAAKSCKFLAAWGARRAGHGCKAQPAAAVLLFAVYFLRNTRAGLRIARRPAGNAVFDPFLYYILIGTPLEQGLHIFGEELK